MLIGWSPHQASDDPRQPAAYLLDTTVSKTIGAQREWEVRTPAPELLCGHPSVVQSAIAALRFQRTTRTATLSFDRSDIDVARFNAGEAKVRRSIAAAIDLFLEAAFAGVPVACRPPVFVGTHTHTGSLEVNIVMPRFVRTETGKLRSYNPHPPMRGSQNAFDALGDFLNAEFDWANPRAPERALAIKGPDWAEKRVAAAERHGVKFTSDATPKLFLLQAAKMIAASRHGQKRSGFLSIFRDVVAATKYHIRPGPGDAIILVLETDPHPFILRGASLCRTEVIPSEPAPPSLPESLLSENWQRRASWNASEYSNDIWAEPEPEWVHRGKSPRLVLPSCHPDCSKPVARPGRFARLADRLAAGLRHLRARVSRMAAEHMISTCLSIIDLAPFGKIKNKLETINHDITDSKSEEPGGVDGGALRAALSRSGKRSRNRYGVQDPRPHRRNDSNPNGDGTAHRSACPSRSHDQNRAAAGTETTDPVRRSGSDLPRYLLDPGAALARPLRAVDVLRAMSVTVGRVLPTSKFDISMDHQGGFKVAGPDWEIAISRGREVSGVGKLSARSYHLFIDGMVGQLGTPLVEGAFPAEEDVDYAP